ncbi:MAG: alpha-2,8-polysialyltransferase family protein [Oscillospiraceae bacterium]|jgi:hypothetical protein|nr:alpha-2,8-polysialyltransferase family protein [Oscillospiraceae bacterium]
MKRLISALTVYQLTEMLCMLRPFTEDDVFLCSWKIWEKYPRLSESKIIPKIFSDDKVRFPRGDSFLDYLFSEKDIDVKKFDEIYVGGCQASFGIHLVEAGMSFTYFEEMAGMLSIPENLMAIDSSVDQYGVMFNPNHEKALKYGIYHGTNPLFKKVVCDYSLQKPEVLAGLEGKTVDFNLPAALRELQRDDPEFLHELCWMFNVPDYIHFDENDALVFTQHFSQLKQLTFEEHITLYQYFCDYFLNGYNLVFKPHPTDLMYYKKIFPNCEVIHQVFPSDLMPFVCNRRPALAATVWSSAIDNFGSFYDGKLKLTMDYLQSFSFAHSYFAALEFLRFAGLADNVCTIGVDSVHFDALARMNGYAIHKIRHCSLLTETDDGAAVVVGKADGFTASSWSGFMRRRAGAVLFLDNDGGCAFIDAMRPDIDTIGVYPIRVRKTKQQDNEFYSLLEDEYLYVCSSDKETLRMAVNHTMSKVLEHSGLELEVKAPTTLEERRIMELEGMLNAYQRRLKAEVEKNALLERELTRHRGILNRRKDIQQ